MSEAKTSARRLVDLVFVEALGASVTPLLPLPFMDDYVMKQLLRRITRKVVARGGEALENEVEKAVVEGYLRAGESGLADKLAMVATRLAARKAAVLLDVKKSHDVFGESVAYALALDVAVELRALHVDRAHTVGGAIYRSTQSVGSAVLDVLAGAGRDVFHAPDSMPDGGRFARMAGAIERRVDEARGDLAYAMRYELSLPDPTVSR